MITTYEFEVAFKNAIIDYNTNTFNEIFTIEDISVVWFCKTLQNVKAILIDNGDNQRMYEITFNGSKKELYLDCYIKTNSKCIPFTELNFKVSK